MILHMHAYNAFWSNTFLHIITPTNPILPTNSKSHFHILLSIYFLFVHFCEPLGLTRTSYQGIDVEMSTEVLLTDSGNITEFSVSSSPVRS